MKKLLILPITAMLAIGCADPAPTDLSLVANGSTGRDKGFAGNHPESNRIEDDHIEKTNGERGSSCDPGSWEFFLQHLPMKSGPVVDYAGREVVNQSKAYALLDYDIGSADLQQCADALIRLRAEFLFSKGRQQEIGFHFTSGHLFTWDQYCAGKRPVVRSSSVSFTNTRSCARTHENLRRYLDIIYSYAGTISLYRELKEVDEPSIGTVIITPGSPGHCTILINDSTGADGTRFFQLAEGYTPAQSIYVLANTADGPPDPWYRINQGVITTSSYRFTNYKFGKFE